MLATDDQRAHIKNSILATCEHAIRVADVPKDDFSFVRSNFATDMAAFLKLQYENSSAYAVEQLQLSNFYLSNFMFAAESPEHAVHLLRQSSILNLSESLLTTGFIPIKDLLFDHEVAYARFVSERSNRKYDGSTKYCEHLLQNPHIIDNFLDVVPINLGRLSATAGQVAVAMWGSSRVDVDVVASAQTASSDQSHFKRQKILVAGTAPSLRINSSLMGAGKTFQSVMTALYPLLSDAAFEGIRMPTRRVDAANLTEDEVKPLLRCVVYVVPVALKKQWLACLKNFLHSLTDKIDLLYEIRGRPLSSLAANRPTIWLLPLNKTVGTWLRASPGYRFISLIVDEATAPIMTRGADDIAKPAMTHILSATPESLSNLSHRSDNPISDALGSNPCPCSDASWVSYIHCFLPEPIRALANANAVAKMPRGVQNVVLRTKIFNLATSLGRNGNAANDNVFKPKTFVDFLRSVSPPHATDRSCITHTQLEELIGMVRGQPLTFDLVVVVLRKAADMHKPIDDPVVNSRIVEKKRALQRVVANIDGVASGEIEDPITLSPMERHETVLLPCCLNAISRFSAAKIHMTTRTCPLCRAELEAVQFDDVPPAECAAADGGAGVVDEVARLDFSKPFMELINDVSAKRLQPLDAIAATVLSACRRAPSSRTPPARIILAASSLGLGVSTGADALLKLIAKYAPELEVVSPGGVRRFDPIRFNSSAFEHPMLLLLDASLHSSGLDLPSVTHTIVLGTARSDLLSQTISRALRMGGDGGGVKYIVSILS